jgi:hypothetical protein
VGAGTLDAAGLKSAFHGSFLLSKRLMGVIGGIGPLLDLSDLRPRPGHLADH